LVFDCTHFSTVSRDAKWSAFFHLTVKNVAPLRVATDQRVVCFNNFETSAAQTGAWRLSL